MKDFKNVRFKGVFRHYQQNVLDNVKIHLEDKRIHIVAAPGSGKTTLGLELIRFLNEPALILSPSITIRNQWKSRFENGFLHEELVDDYVSLTLKDPKLITSITYQGLHAAFHRLVVKEETEFDEVEVVDYTTFNLMKTIKAIGIKTICLDEAHHLRTEWHASIMKVIESLDDVTVIALTATPPYDSTPYEWNKYIELCGEIDEEIFVPELVSRNNLCPHQDYIYFNYPTDDEISVLKEYRQQANATIDEIIESPLLQEFITRFLEDYNNNVYQLYEEIEHYITLLHRVQYIRNIPYRLRKILKGRSIKEQADIEYMERLFEFIIKQPEIFGEELSNYVKRTLKDAGLMERQKVYLKYNTKLKTMIISSVGKLKSIAKIAKFESEQLQENLRMLILTDYIKKELVHTIGTTIENQVIGAIPIFEEVRRTVQKETRIVVLTGSLIILPTTLLPHVERVASEYSTSFQTTKLELVDYHVITFKNSNKHSVQILTKLFEAGYIDILIGTKSLLGEGWDSPSINTLVMASFVGSFMLSNQMRGRAIRIDKHNPDKVASVWHLATVEPYNVVSDHRLRKWNLNEKRYEKEHIISNDFDMLKRRFQSFLGPVYDDHKIESGIERVSIIKPPYDESSFQSFNTQMMEYAKDRNGVRQKWLDIVGVEYNSDILETSEIPKEFWPYEVVIYDSTLLVLSNAITISAIQSLGNLSEAGFGTFLLGGIVIAFYVYVMSQLLPRIIGNLSPKKSVESLSKALLQTLQDIHKVRSESAHISVSKDRNLLVHTSLTNGTRHDKTIFASCAKELFSKIENPRYIIVKTRQLLHYKFHQYNVSYAVPKLISTNKEYVTAFAKNLDRLSGGYDIVYTHNEQGRKALLKCKRRSIVSRYLINVRSNRVLQEKK